MKKALILSLILLLVSSGSVAAVASAAPTSNSVYNTQVNVPFYVYGGQTFTMYVNNTYGFSNYTVTVYFSGENMTGFSPTNTYHNFSVSNPDFSVKIKAPQESQQLTFLVKTTASSSSPFFSLETKITLFILLNLKSVCIEMDKRASDKDPL